MKTALISHPASLAHDMGPGHPERPDRVRALMKRFGDEAFDDLVRVFAPRAEREMIERVHPAAYIDALAAARPGPGGSTRLDPDTVMNEGTWEAIHYAAGGACLAVDRVMRREVANAFVAMRPPGHHAERSTAMGFCFFNTAAIAARHAQAIHGAERVAIVDFDVHHGNGTQEIFWSDPSVLYCSTHQMPLFPGTGAADERGDHGTIVNAPLQPGDDGEAFREAIESAILPRLDAFAPHLVIVSAGFDAHRLDPLANLNLEASDFDWVTRALMAVADKHAGGQLVSVLEGGYDLDGLTDSAAAHVLGLMEAGLD
ncbi:histone deacetylase family protein [Lichenihabitans sp. PAMC28606]|uniref:histone deacetylase family protein n=1 Tax=Lichenihabitans sp. PAMC28606 TaxID=2880932 RepID=UPI001D09D79B|nr:histone deacetylase family protein [Lichenihabitans sp. PAMC28606]UDL94959.1 histone deacetylase family protein [Lichenihabitans sp. PAMC28606]